MLKLIESQLGLTASTQYLDANESCKKKRRVMHDVTNSPDIKSNADCTVMEYGGNPLDLENVCDLSLIDDQLTLKNEAATSTIFDYSRYKCLNPEQLSTAFANYGQETLFLTKGAPDNPPELVALFPGPSNDFRRILKAHTIPNPDMKLTCDDLRLRYMPFSTDVKISYESIYNFSFSSFHVEFAEPIGGLLTPPHEIVIGKLTTRVSPYSSVNSPLPNIKTDIDRLKRLLMAFQNEVPWTAIVPVAQSDLQERISKCLAQTRSDIVAASGHRLVRDLDFTERAWEALKDVPDRKSAKAGFMRCLDQLQENASLFSVGPNNFTQFAKWSRSCVLSRGKQSHFDLLALKMLLEVGVNKVTNDCLAVIRTVSPRLEQTFVTKFLSGDLNLELRLTYLHHLYKIACLAAALGSMAHISVSEKEIRPLLFDTTPSAEEFASVFETEELEVSLVCTNECSIPISSLVVKLASFTPDWWAMRLSASDPMNIEKRLVYECVPATAGFATILYCHVLELTDTVWLPNH